MQLLGKYWMTDFTLNTIPAFVSRFYECLVFKRLPLKRAKNKLEQALKWKPLFTHLKLMILL